MLIKLIGLFLCLSLMAPVVIARSGLKTLPELWIDGLKYPNSKDEWGEPVSTSARLYTSNLGGYTKLLPFILPSPDQEDAGSCLYMSLTGIAEWWLAKLNPLESRQGNGPIDLSERFMMNIAGVEESANGVENWRTDSIFLYNDTGYGVKNQTFRFTKGWYVTDKDGNYQIADAGDKDSAYGTSYNWINTLPNTLSDTVPLPVFERQIIFADPESDQWNVGVTPADIVDQVKVALQENEAPVQVLYNHYGYWHAVMIVGFNDQASSNGCSFTAKSAPYFTKKAQKYRTLYNQTKDAAQKKIYAQRVKRYTLLSEKITQSYQDHGGCSGKGVFYVRDSLYVDPKGVIYDYDLSQKGEESRLTKPVILREYEWLEVLGNHVLQILVGESR